MKKWALVTGASSGIGAELARVYSEEGYNVVLVARRKQKLAKLAKELQGNGSEVHVIAMDLSAKEAARELFDAVQQLDIQIDALVNNAGFTYLGAFLDQDLDNAHEMMQLNLVTLVSLTYLFANPMVDAGKGHVLNLASTTGFQPTPGYTLYSAGKALVRSFSEGLTEELKGTGVSVTVLCPGPTDSEMIDDVKTKSSVGPPEFMIADSRSVAKAGFDAATSGEAVCVPGLINKVSTIIAGQAPRWIVRSAFGVMGRKMINGIV
jgi:hypothetical protein